jgi:hypothetical protein
MNKKLNWKKNSKKKKLDSKKIDRSGHINNTKKGFYFDILLILFIFTLSMIVPIIVASSQNFIADYGDDIAIISWAQDHHSDIFSIFSDKIGTGYRPIRNMWFAIGYTIWSSDAFYYYLLDGIFVSLSMVFLYLLGKTLHSKIAGVISVLLYLLLDGTFIMISKINFIAFSGEILFITSALYFSIRYFKNISNNINASIDNKLAYIAIILSVLAFLSKEPSILIIPAVNLIYIYYSGIWKKNYKYLIINLIPFIYLFFLMFYISPDVSSGNSTGLIQRISNNLQFYVNDEYTYQFKTAFLIIISLIIAGYYFKTQKLKAEIMLCIIWIIVGTLPLLITQQPVQPTYLLETNIGMVLLIGIIIAEGFKEINLKKINLIPLLLSIGIIAQLIVVPTQLSNMRDYNKMASDSEKTFFETVESIKQVPTKTIFYFPDNIRQKYGMQINEIFFQQYLCIIGSCDVKVTTQYSNSTYIILPSSLDIYIMLKEMPEEKDKVSVVTQIQNGNDYGIILKK